MLRSPVALRRTARKQTTDAVPSRDSELVALSEKSPQERRKATGIFDEEKRELESGVGSLSSGKTSSPPSDLPAGRTKVQKLDGSVYRPWGTRSRSSSEAGSDTSFCRGGPGRAVCGEPVKSTESGVSCDRCEKWFHASCQGIPKTAYDALTKYRMLAWLCPPCKESIKGTEAPQPQLATLESKVQELSAKVDEHLKLGQAALVARVEQLTESMSAHMKRVSQSLKEQEQSVVDQTRLIERSIRDNLTQKASYADMVRGTCSDVIDKMSAKISSIPQEVAAQNASKDMKHVAEVFDSFVDRDRRKNNLVVHNLPEPESESATERSVKDILRFQEVIKDTFRIQVAVTRCFRVGKSVKDKARLLIVTLDTPGVKHEILRLAPQLRQSEKWGNIYITPDLSRSEREAARKVREELAVRRAAGETNITIRKGRVVSTVTSSARQEATVSPVTAPSGPRGLSAQRDSAATGILGASLTHSRETNEKPGTSQSSQAVTSHTRPGGERAEPHA